MRQVGPLPMWGWIGIAVVGYLLWRKLKGSSSAATTTGSATGSTATGVPTETVSYPSGGSYSGPVGYAPAGISGTPPGQGGSSPGNTGNTFSNQTQIGAGYGEAPSAGSNVVTVGNTSYSQVNQGYAALLAAGQGANVYYQASPGVFLPVTYQVASQGTASGAPLFIGPPHA